MFSKFLDPKNDVAFKKVFGSTKNKDILIHFLNDVITFKEGSPITEITFLKASLDPGVAAQKTSVVDISCSDEHGNQYIVEMQIAKQTGFEKRAQYYAAKSYSSQSKVSSPYSELKAVIFIAIVDFIMFPDKKAYKSDHITLDRETYQHDLKDFSFTFLELPKFKKSINELSTMVEKWMYFFKHAGETSSQDVEKIVGSDEILERAYEELDRFSWNDEELRGYDQLEKYEDAYQSTLSFKYLEGKIEGEIEGKIKGKTLEKEETVYRLLTLHTDKNTIAAATGLPLSEIERLISTFKNEM
ncbi:MAG: Rpn family recombination-promoting nuclease/putative transposase [Chlamydia sp.]